MRATEPLRFGRMYYRQISGDGVTLRLPVRLDVHARVLPNCCTGSEVLVAYNVSDQPRHDAVVVDATLHADGSKMTYLYPEGGGTEPVHAAGGARYLSLGLAAHQFVILG